MHTFDTTLAYVIVFIWVTQRSAFSSGEHPQVWEETDTFLIPLQLQLSNIRLLYKQMLRHTDIPSRPLSNLLEFPPPLPTSGPNTFNMNLMTYTKCERV